MIKIYLCLFESWYILKDQILALLHDFKLRHAEADELHHLH